MAKVVATSRCHTSYKSVLANAASFQGNPGYVPVDPEVLSSLNNPDREPPRSTLRVTQYLLERSDEQFPVVDRPADYREEANCPLFLQQVQKSAKYHKPTPAHRSARPQASPS